MARLGRLKGWRLAASLLLYTLAALVAAERLGGPIYLLVLGAPLAAIDPLLATLYLEAYAAASAIVWGAKPSLPEYIAGLAPLAALAPSSLAGIALMAATYTSTTALALYTLTLVHRVMDPKTWPPEMRIVLDPLLSNQLAAWLGTVAAAAAAVYAARRLSEPIASALSPVYASRLLREWVAREAEKVRRASAWYHRLLSWSLGLLAILPVVFTVNAFIAAMYAAVSVYTPDPRIREALQLARGAISTTVFWATGWIVSRSIRRMLAGEWTPTPSKTAPILLMVLAALLSILYVNPAAAARVLACIALHCPAASIPPAPVDATLEQMLRSTWEMLEASEDMLRFLTRLFWS